MSSTSLKPDDSGTRNRVLHAAMDLLADGTADATMGAIAAQAGISRQAVYLHFQNRDDLLVAVADWGNERIGLPQRIARLTRLKTGRSMLANFAHTVAWQVNLIGPAMLAINRLLEKDSGLLQRWRSRSGRAVLVQQIVAALHTQRDLRRGVGQDEAIAVVLAFSQPDVVLSLLKSGMTEQKAAQHLHRAIEGAICRQKRPSKMDTREQAAL